VPGFEPEFFLFHNITIYVLRLSIIFGLMYPILLPGLSIIYPREILSALKICGWWGGSIMRQADDSYIFIVFIINKVVGFSVLPFIHLTRFYRENGLHRQAL
jgi:hypothetical protein